MLTPSSFQKDYNLVGDLPSLIQYAQIIYQTCMVNNKAGGVVHDDVGYSVFIRGGETCPGWVEQDVTRSGAAIEAQPALVGREESETPTPGSTKPSTSPLEPVNAETPNPCSDIICISEMHPVYNATSELCECEWINGFEGAKPLKSTSSKRILALDARGTVRV